jgi:hypothetical protein
MKKAPGASCRPGPGSACESLGNYSVALLDSLRTMRPAPRSVTPPATSSATSSPVKGSEPVLALLVVAAVVAVVRWALAEHTDGALYAKQLELESAKEAAGNINIAATNIVVKIRFMGLTGSPFLTQALPYPRALPGTHGWIIPHAPPRSNMERDASKKGAFGQGATSSMRIAWS